MAPFDSKQHELLSVYLDGETTPAEKAEVERWIEKDAEARQLLAELRSVHEDVRGLPAPALDPGFGAELLQRIESEANAEQTEPSEEGEPHAFDWRRLRDRFLNGPVVGLRRADRGRGGVVDASRSTGRSRDGAGS